VVGPNILASSSYVVESQGHKILVFFDQWRIMVVFFCDKFLRCFDSFHTVLLIIPIS
jgi:hypothetical protein